MNKHTNHFRMTLAALFFALSYAMPFLTGHIPEIGAMLCPMHLPVLLCGFICGPVWGAVVGMAVPLFRSLTIAMPPLFPTALCMSFELAAYGVVSGLMHKLLPCKKICIYCSLVSAMIAGRLVWGAAMFACVGMTGEGFTLAAFLAGAITNAVPGIIVQIVLVPLIVMLFENMNVFKKRVCNEYRSK